MHLTEQQIGQIKYEVEVNHRSYKCIATKLGVSVKDVQRIAKPIVAKRLDNIRTKKRLEQIISEARYDRKPYDTIPLAADTPSGAAKAIAGVIIVCGLLIVLAITAGIIKLCLGL